jgi:serine/threonine protein kinase
MNFIIIEVESNVSPSSSLLSSTRSCMNDKLSSSSLLVSLELCRGKGSNGESCECGVSQEKLLTAYKDKELKNLLFNGVLCVCGHAVGLHASAPVSTPFVFDPFSVLLRGCARVTADGIVEIDQEISGLTGAFYATVHEQYSKHGWLIHADFSDIPEDQPLDLKLSDKQKDSLKLQNEREHCKLLESLFNKGKKSIVNELRKLGLQLKFTGNSGKLFKPDFCIFPHIWNKANEFNIATIIELKRSSISLKQDAHIGQVIYYCQQILLHQPWRGELYAILTNLKVICFFRVRRTGNQYPEGAFRVEASDEFILANDRTSQRLFHYILCGEWIQRFGLKVHLKCGGTIFTSPNCRLYSVDDRHDSAVVKHAITDDGIKQVQNEATCLKFLHKEAARLGLDSSGFIQMLDNHAGPNFIALTPRCIGSLNDDKNQIIQKFRLLYPFSLFVEVFRNLAILHSMRMFHCDARLANVLLYQQDPEVNYYRLILADFGCAKLLKENEKLFMSEFSV